jgi:hypothetical protein
VRLGRAGRGRQVLPEHLPGRPVAEAAPRRVVEPVGEPPQAGPPERLGRALARQEAAGAAVRVLDASLLPGGVRVAPSKPDIRATFRVAYAMARRMVKHRPGRSTGEALTWFLDAGFRRFGYAALPIVRAAGWVVFATSPRPRPARLRS